ncbi:exodeoxyribonuclease V subunit alpha [Candidatus Thiothrix sp. Deng01]|uniref:RecBCD enzyme subunit RecD n=1 Tax=Candidatus Thiothrix phosphatis TaxID=3112415 RepID=A0ABU6D0Y6_9GAMM|nr:exodeoxyribonuclease V subunit alpha [Candidatus Thiothrix sp. Deng01]MEB4592738.1 exodeoxyribonuclease V subunit alpha [Candidatus Thiothrix sp. Deng01]
MSQSPSHPLDEHLAGLLSRLDGGHVETRSLQALIQYVSACTRDGVIAAPLADAPVADIDALRGSPVVGGEGEYKPLVVGGSHAWLYRYWLYEERLAGCIRARMDSVPANADDAPADLQQRAVELARRNRFLIIAGGPGTGKTTTVTRILAHLLEGGADPARILLAAPTGKAVMRMQESIRETRQRLALPDAIANCIPDQASTLHRMLGYIPNRNGFRHHAANPLPADVVIVDEASMIDISLMTHLFEATPPEAKLILLGDKDQLASVETGSIFRDLCNGEALSGQMLALQTSYRFAVGDGVGQLAQAIREADEGRLLEVLDSPAYGDVTLDDAEAGLDAGWLQHSWRDYVAAVRAGDKEAVFRAFNALRILTPLRKGRLGVETLNAWVDGVMQRRLPAHDAAQKPWYVGRPVMVTQNDYRQNLFNGDIGIALPDANAGLRVWFPAGEAGQYRAVAPVRLPAHETAWAMTIHKSQGSEFSQVLLILPEVEDSPLLGRELLYTAVTRAKQGLHILASRTTLRRALRQATPPASQLQERLLREAIPYSSPAALSASAPSRD